MRAMNLSPTGPRVLCTAFMARMRCFEATMCEGLVRNTARSCWLSGLLLLVSLAAFPGSAKAANPSPGTANFLQVGCPTNSGIIKNPLTICYKVTYTDLGNYGCGQGGSSDNFVAYMKVIPPTQYANTPHSIFFIGGGGGNNWYDTTFTYGSLVVESVLQAGYIAVEINFSDLLNPASESAGWLTAPTSTGQGPLSLACRFADIAYSYYNNMTVNPKPGVLMGATGNSAGSGLIAYAISQYALAGKFWLVELSSGPVFSRVDYGCECNQPAVATSCGQGTLSYCYLGNASMFVDPSFGITNGVANTNCSSATTSHSVSHDADFLLASILNGSQIKSFGTTTVNVVYGGRDSTQGVALGTAWITDSIKNGNTVTQQCVGDAPHKVPNALDGALKIACDLTSPAICTTF